MESWEQRSDDNHDSMTKLSEEYWLQLSTLPPRQLCQSSDARLPGIFLSFEWYPVWWPCENIQEWCTNYWETASQAFMCISWSAEFNIFTSKLRTQILKRFTAFYSCIWPADDFNLKNVRRNEIFPTDRKKKFEAIRNKWQITTHICL